MNHHHPQDSPRTSVPAPYVAGTITLRPGEVSNLLELIQEQLAENCPGSAAELKIWAGPGNMGSVSIGAASFKGGPLSQTNFAYRLTPNSQPVIYRSTFPGNSTPLGELQVFATSANQLHVEVVA